MYQLKKIIQKEIKQFCDFAKFEDKYSSCEKVFL